MLARPLLLPAPLVAAKRRAKRALSRTCQGMSLHGGGIQDQKTVGTCRGTSGTARRCETACNEGVITDMPRHVPTVGRRLEKKQRITRTYSIRNEEL